MRISKTPIFTEKYFVFLPRYKLPRPEKNKIENNTVDME